MKTTHAAPTEVLARVVPTCGVRCIPAYRADDDTYWLTVDCPNGWDDVKRLTKATLEFQGRIYFWRSWNSDRNVSNFLADNGADVAHFVRLRQ